MIVSVFGDFELERIRLPVHTSQWNCTPTCPMWFYAVPVFRIMIIDCPLPTVVWWTQVVMEDDLFATLVHQTWHKIFLFRETRIQDSVAIIPVRSPGTTSFSSLTIHLPGFRCSWSGRTWNGCEQASRACTVKLDPSRQLLECISFVRFRTCQ